MTLVWCTFVVITLALVSQRPGLCRAFKYFPYGYSVASLASHLVLAFRIHSIYERKAAVLYSMLVLAVVDCAVQMSANHAAYGKGHALTVHRSSRVRCRLTTLSPSSCSSRLFRAHSRSPTLRGPSQRDNLLHPTILSSVRAHLHLADHLAPHHSRHDALEEYRPSPDHPRSRHRECHVDDSEGSRPLRPCELTTAGFAHVHIEGIPR